MRARTLQHPGVEQFEVDYSQFTDSTNRVTAVVAGFAHQGRSDRVIENISDTQALLDYFGEPQTDAEKYFYYGAKKIIDNKGRGLFVRIPYANESEDYVPAYKYAIEEGSVKDYTNDKAYIPTLDVTDTVFANLENFGMHTKSEVSSFIKVTDETKFTGHCVISSLVKSSGGEVGLLSSWSEASSGARFVTLCDAFKTTGTSCDADEDTRFVTMTNIEEVATDWAKILSSQIATLRTAQKAAIVSGLSSIGMTLSGDITWTDDTVVDTSDEVFMDFDGKTFAEGKYLTEGFRDGSYIQSAKFKIDSNATFVAKKDGKAVQSSSLAYELRHATAETGVVSGLTTSYSNYCRVTDQTLKNAVVYKSTIVDTATMKGIEGLVGKNTKAATSLKDIDRVVRIHRLDKDGFVKADIVEEVRDGNLENISGIIGCEKGFVIVNSTNKVLDVDTFNNNGEEVLGIVPFVFTGFNKLPLSHLVDVSETEGNTSIFQCVNTLDCGASEKNSKDNRLNPNGFNKLLATVGSFTVGADTISQDVASKFPALVAKEGGKLPGDEMNYTAILVAELKTDANYGNRIVVTPKELFYGNFDRKSPLYLPELVRLNSNYIELYTNYEPKAAYKKDLDKMITVVTPIGNYDEGLNNFWFLNETPCGVLGYRSNMVTKRIKYANIAKTLTRMQSLLADVDQYDIDFIEDAGLSTIAQFVLRAQGGEDTKEGTKFDSRDYDNPQIMKGKDINASTDVSTWRQVASKLVSFSETTRKDCYTCVDAPRNLTLDYDAKIVKKNGKNSIADFYTNRLKYITGVSSNYAGGITQWVQVADDFTGRLLWLPPSIFKVGASIAAQYNYGYPWYVATGTERGKLNDAVDISISLDDNSQDVTYSNGWNYLRQFSDSGIVIWGQKNLSAIGSSLSMLDRENVRRMFLYGERLSRKAMKKHLFKPITTARLENVTDDLTPIWSDIKDSEGAYEFKVLCNSRNNTPETIMRNELRATVAVKPTALAEYIILGFISVGLNITITEDMMANA